MSQTFNKHPYFGTGIGTRDVLFNEGLERGYLFAGGAY